MLLAQVLPVVLDSKIIPLSRHGNQEAQDKRPVWHAHKAKARFRSFQSVLHLPQSLEAMTYKSFAMVNPSRVPSCRVDRFDAITSNEELEIALCEFSAVVCEKTHVLLLEGFFERPLVVEIILTGQSLVIIYLPVWINHRA